MIQNYLQASFGYTDYQIEQIRYTVVSLLSEISKLFIMGIFFTMTRHLPQYLTAILVLLILRTCTGGLHFKRYSSCLLVSFLIFYLGICHNHGICPDHVYCPFQSVHNYWFLDNLNSTAPI